MRKPNMPANEKARLEALLRYNILDTLPEKVYDNITLLASVICEVPICLITFLDDKRQWFKSKVGVEISETSRDFSFCSYGLLSPNEPLIVDNLYEDERFKSHPLVLGPPYIQFYAGVSLLTTDGYPLGALCVIDTKTRSITPSQLTALKTLASQVMEFMEIAKSVKELEKTQIRLLQSNKNLEEFAHIISHDIKGPLGYINQLTNLFEEDFTDKMPIKAKETLSLINEISDNSIQLINGVMKYSKATFAIQEDKKIIDLQEFMPNLIKRLKIPPHIDIQIAKNLPTILTSTIALQQIMENLINNAIKYNDKEQGWIKMDCQITKDNYIFQISDNGQGIPKEKLETIFNLFYIGNEQDAKRKNSSGVGLSIVKKLVENLGGTIQVTSKETEGTTFQFSLKRM